MNIRANSLYFVLCCKLKRSKDKIPLAFQIYSWGIMNYTYKGLMVCKTVKPCVRIHDILVLSLC